MLFSVLLATAMLLLRSSSGHDEQCNCKDPTYTSSWGQFTPTSQCSGKCNGMQLGVQECYSSINGLVLPITLCHVERICQLPESCEGTWTPWSNTGKCSKSCEQEQSRICLKVRNNVFLQKKLCLK